MKNLKHIFIIYNPGYAGNFLQRVFSLSKETVPVMDKSFLSEPKLNSSIEERLELYSFKNVRSTFLNWQKFHRNTLDFYDYKIIEEINNHNTFSHIIFSMHLPEFLNCKDQIDEIENNDFYYVDLDLSKYQKWIDASMSDLNFFYRLDERYSYNNIETVVPNVKSINLTAMLDSQQGFVDEYISVSKKMNLSVDTESAILLYKEWYQTRVEYYS